MKVSGELYGDWDKLDRILKNLRNNSRDYQTTIRRIGEHITEAIWDLIESQSIELEALTKEYRARKISEGHDERILIRTGDFLNSIQITDIQVSGTDILVHIGVEDGVTKTGLSMKDLAHYLEYGTENMPARAPFRKSWEEIRKDVKNEVRDKIQAIILEDIR